ncbi:hypothetical protein [Kosakonia sacchari]|uniref:hypothetical protein n=1 Tax=Kosakonia sacchari TaxID=1158459 RepID=UPI00158521D7|nr:hypothetical protein [Kosakonia sacchari]NUL36649.1 hypothetical protein [Kosakonia sacchari]
MAYGVQLFDANGNELIERFVPAFIVDYITSGSGTTTYGGVQGKTLTPLILNYITSATTISTPPATASVSGNTLTWANASSDCPIMVVYQ